MIKNILPANKRLTAMAKKSGCEGKIRMNDFIQVLSHTPSTKSVKEDHPIAGIGMSGNVGVYHLTDDIHLVQTVEVITPTVDDPYMFGQIAAANALNNIYAVGGEPKTVLHVAGFPIQKLSHDILEAILKGASDKAKEAGAVTTGSHSIDIQEPTFGLSCTGIAQPDSMFRNTSVQPGDQLILTKPLGTGILASAMKHEKASKEEIEAASTTMTALNKTAAEILKGYSPHAVSTISELGLLGHSYEMANRSAVSFEINYQEIPILNGSISHAKSGTFSNTTKSNNAWLKNKVTYDKKLKKYDRFILSDSITSGGLLISMSEDEAANYLMEMKKKSTYGAYIIGEAKEKKEKSLYVK